MTFSASGKLLAPGSQGGMIRLWDTAPGKELHPRLESESHLFALAFSPDGKHLFTGGGDRSLACWRLDTGKPVRRFGILQEPVLFIGMSPDGKTLFSAGGWKDSPTRFHLWDVDQFKDSCELVKISLAVWVANSEAFPAFDRWMFSFDSAGLWRPRSLDDARAKAVELVGQAKFDAARADPWINQYMQASIRLFGETVQGGNAVPKLAFGSRWVTPEPNDTDEFLLILHDSLAIPQP